jgi:hypothetical protein
VSETALVLRKTITVLKSESFGLVHAKSLSASPAVTDAELTLLGERLSIVMVAEPESVPDCAFVDVKDVTVPVTEYATPGTAAMFACDLGVTRTLNCTVPVVTGIGVPPLKLTVSDDGLETAAKYKVDPSSDVILTSEIPA